MKREVYSYPESSFLSLEKDAEIIIGLMMKNERLKKLLYYTTKDCLNKPNIGEDATLELFGKNIKLIPKMGIDENVLNYVFISFTDFKPNKTNPEFRDNAIEIGIICHYDQWQLNDFQLRPFRIAAEIDSMLTNSRLSGIGKLEFDGGDRVVFDNEYAGVCLYYKAIHGEEDKHNPLNPNDAQALIENFNKLFND